MVYCDDCGPFTYTPQGEGQTACTVCAAAGCNLTVRGVCGSGCGLNFYWDEAAALGGHHNDTYCRMCPPTLLNAYFPCARDIVACMDPPPGLIYYTGDGTIVQCPNGAQADPLQRSRCIACTPGRFAVNGSGCLACGAGYFSNESARSACQACPPGTQSGGGSSSCTLCAAGTYAAGAAASACKACAPGSYAALLGARQCTLCSAGTYDSRRNNHTNEGAITACTDLCDGSQGLYSGVGATACIFCAGGLVGNDASACVGCPPGTYYYFQQQGGRRTCVQCPLGLANPSTYFALNSSVCVPCVGASYASMDATHCIDARPGYVPKLFLVMSLFLWGSVNDSVACPVGTFRGAGDVACLVCREGTWSFHEAATACDVCPPGTYRDSAAVGACAPCPPGSISNPSLNLSWVQCAACPPGSDSDQAATVCTPCPANTFLSASGCQKCPPTMYSLSGATTCSYCPDWTVHFYSSGGGCELCPEGTYTTTYADAGGRTGYTCEACPAGTQNPLKGARACASCGGHGLVPNPQATACVPCPLGQTSEGGVCEDCAAGTEGGEGGLCLPCGTGTFKGESSMAGCGVCPAGTFAASMGQTACAACSPGAYANQSGRSACNPCDAQSSYASASGSTACLPRTRQCAQGQYVVVRSNRLDEDNACADCLPCDSGFVTVRTLTSGWTSYLEYGATGVLSCPGNTTTPGYRCISSNWPAGQYLVPQSMAGMSPYPSGPDDASTFRAAACPDLLPSSSSLMAYVVGKTFECYVGCKYGLNIKQVDTYVNAYPDPRGLEQPYYNVFYAGQAKAYAALLCLPCPLGVCPYGRYRPASSSGDCGAPCLLDSSLCPDNNEGCNGRCDPPPPNAVTTGGASGINTSCPWVCLPGYYYYSHNNQCASCTDPIPCPAGFAPVSLSMCLPLSTLADLCRPCPSQVGGIASRWAADGCLYACFLWGYYGVDGGHSCLPCTSLNNVSCPVGTFRDVPSCLSRGVAPDCVPCTNPLRQEVSFTSSAVGVDNCAATCNSGYHTVVHTNGSSGGAITYLADGQTTVGVRDNLQCLACTFTDAVQCHGSCAAGYYRSGGSGCKACTATESCPAGFYAPLCTGNGTANVACVPCAPDLLLSSSSKQVREFVPYNLPWSVALAGLIYYADGRTCPTACIAGYVLDPLSSTLCVSCKDYVRSMGCEALPSVQGQPRPCDFIYSHWNATPGNPWWTQPPPSFLRLRPPPIRNGVCWACQTGLGQDGNELCSLLPGFGEQQDYEVYSVPALPSTGDEIYIAFQEPRPSLPSSSSPYYYYYGARRRLLVTVNASSSPSRKLQQQLDAVVVAPCPVGQYNDRTMRRCALCPAGTSTYGVGSTDASYCKCMPGYQPQNEGCAPCPVDWYRNMSSTVCSPCPEGETTYGKLGSTACACRAGSRRAAARSGCTPCAANTFCVPCWDTQQDCPSLDGVSQFACFPMGVSPEGSSSILNCTCESGLATILRPNSDPLLVSSYYCMRSPPNSEYNEQRKRVECLPGWNSTWTLVDGDPQLVACTLCAKGHYYDDSGGTKACVPCPLGTYTGVQDTIGACTSCPQALSTTLSVGSTSVADCGCPLPTVRGADGQCETCAADEYPSPTLGCVPCPPNSILQAGAPMSASGCRCTAGFYHGANNSSSSALCVPCPVGTYSAHASSMSPCTPCPAGSTTADVGARSLLSCGASAELCLPGYTFSGVGLCRPAGLLA